MPVIEHTLTVREAYDIAIRDMKRCYVEADSIAEAERGASSLVLADQLRGAVSLLEELVDADPCSYDHHGYCQTHSLHEKPCPHERAKSLLGGQ